MPGSMKLYVFKAVNMVNKSTVWMPVEMTELQLETEKLVSNEIRSIAHLKELRQYQLEAA